MSDYYAHPSSEVDDGARIGSNSKIWHWVHVSAGAKIGSNTTLGQNCYVGGKAVIGSNVKIQNNVSIYDSVTIEDNVFCGPSMVFTNVINPRSFIERKDEYKKTLVKQNASIGANATIICGVEIGAYALVGAGSVVTKDVKPFALVVGNPAKQIGWVDLYANRLDLPVSSVDVIEIKCSSNDGYFLLDGDKLTYCKP